MMWIFPLMSPQLLLQILKSENITHTQRDCGGETEVFARESRRKSVKCRQNQLFLLGNTENFRLLGVRYAPHFRGSCIYFKNRSQLCLNCS